MSRPYFALNDYYYGLGLNVSTTELSIPDNDEREHYNETVAETTVGVQQVSKTHIFGAVGLFVGLLVFLHFIE